MPMKLQFFGGRGSESGIIFNIPRGGENFDPYALGERVPETVKEAIGTKGKPKTVADALKNVNPNYSQEYGEFSENCQRCVVAYELRRRGYDVEAQPTYAGDTWSNSFSINGQNQSRWRGAFRHAVSDNVGVKGNNLKAQNKVLQNLAAKMREYGSGSRAVVGIAYRNSHIGHVFNVENNGGRISYVDAQTGQRYNMASMRNLMKVTNTSSVQITRTDNLKISDRAKNMVWQKNRNKK